MELIHSNDLLKRILRGIANCLLSSFNTLMGIWSGPCALFRFHLFSLSWIAFGVTRTSAKVILFDLSPISVWGILLVFSCVKTLAKKVIQDICFFCFRYSHMPIILSKGAYTFAFDCTYFQKYFGFALLSLDN